MSGRHAASRADRTPRADAEPVAERSPGAKPSPGSESSPGAERPGFSAGTGGAADASGSTAPLPTRRSGRHAAPAPTSSRLQFRWSSDGQRTSPWPRIAGAGAASALVLGCALVGSALAPLTATGRPVAAAAVALPTVAEEASGTIRTRVPAEANPTGVAEPVSLTVPAIGVASALVDLGLTPDGGLAVPGDAATAGWFTGGAAPGGSGPAVIAGHVDSAEGPGVFIGLERLETGDDVLVGRADGTTAHFSVTGAVRTTKDEFPTAAVYGPTAMPELRLITCDGDFDERTGHYEDNLVVFARLA